MSVSSSVSAVVLVSGSPDDEESAAAPDEELLDAEADDVALVGSTPDEDELPPDCCPVDASVSPPEASSEGHAAQLSAARTQRALWNDFTNDNL